MAATNGGSPYDWLFMAVARWHLGQRDEARRWLERSARWMKAQESTDPQLERFLAEIRETVTR